MVQPRRYVEAPAAQPVPFGLFSAAVVVPDGDDHLLMGVEYESLMCGSAHLSAAACFDDPDAPDPSSLVADDGHSLVGADAFTVYSLHRCRLVGQGGAAGARADATAKLENNESRAVEGAFAAQISGADDLTPFAGTAVSPLAGLSILEDFARANYGGVPILHMTPGVATVLSGQGVVDRYSGRMETKIGSRVAVGGGYDFGDVGDITPEATQRWLWVTGAVVVRRAAVSVSDMTINARAPKNELSLLAQRGVVITTECITAAVLVQGPTAGTDIDGGGA